MNIIVWIDSSDNDIKYTVLFEGQKAYIIHDIVDETLTESDLVNLMAKDYTTLSPSEVDISVMNAKYKKMSVKELPKRVQLALKKVLPKHS